MNAHFSAHASRHLTGDTATHPIEQRCVTLAALLLLPAERFASGSALQAHHALSATRPSSEKQSAPSFMLFCAACFCFNRSSPPRPSNREYKYSLPRKGSPFKGTAPLRCNTSCARLSWLCPWRRHFFSHNQAHCIDDRPLLNERKQRVIHESLIVPRSRALNLPAEVLDDCVVNPNGNLGLPGLSCNYWASHSLREVNIAIRFSGDLFHTGSFVACWLSTMRSGGRCWAHDVYRRLRARHPCHSFLARRSAAPQWNLGPRGTTRTRLPIRWLLRRKKRRALVGSPLPSLDPIRFPSRRLYGQMSSESRPSSDRPSSAGVRASSMRASPGATSALPRTPKITRP